MTLLAVTIVGRDRPGVIAETTGILAELGASLEDSTMTIFRGHLAMVVVADAEVTPQEAEAALATLADGGSLHVSVSEVPPEEAVPVGGTTYLLSVQGGDRPGIVSHVTHVVAESGGNVTDLSVRPDGEGYLLLAEVELPVSVDPEQLSRDLTTLGVDLGVEVSFRVLDRDLP